MKKSDFLKEELRDLYFQTENVLMLWKTLPEAQQQELLRFKDNLIQKQLILARAIVLINA